MEMPTKEQAIHTFAANRSYSTLCFTWVVVKPAT
jgi:hypothetical protein